MYVLIIAICFALLIVGYCVFKKRNVTIEEQKATMVQNQKLEAIATNLNITAFNQQLHHLISTALVTHNPELKKDIIAIVLMRYRLFHTLKAPAHDKISTLHEVLIKQLNELLVFIEKDECKTMVWCGTFRNKQVKILKAALRSHPITFFSKVSSDLDSAPWVILDSNFKKTHSEEVYQEFFEILQAAIDTANEYWKAERIYTNYQALENELDNILEREANLLQALEITF